jgi:hypothetical protein
VIRRWFHRWFPVVKDASAWKAISAAPDTDPGLVYPDGHQLAGKSKRARLTRPGYDVADRNKLELSRAPVVRLTGPAGRLSVGIRGQDNQSTWRTNSSGAITRGPADDAL